MLMSNGRIRVLQRQEEGVMNFDVQQRRLPDKASVLE